MIFDYALFNGDLVPVSEARVSIFNQALFSSFGIYETVKVDHGRPFYLEEHLRRLFQSARMLELDLGVDQASLARWFDRLLQVDPHATWSLKIIAVGASDSDDSPVIAMQPTVLATFADSLYQAGASVVTFEGERVMPACKSLNTLVNFLARRQATRAGALEGILHHNGQLTEGSRSNLFAVHKGQLITPPTADVLSGITRDIIMHTLRNTEYPVVEAPLPMDISLYDEMFISSTSMHVMPVTQVDGKTVGSGRVGPITKLAMAGFEAHYRQVMNFTAAERP